MYDHNSFLMPNYAHIGGHMFRTDMIDQITSGGCHTLTYWDDLTAIKYEEVDASSVFIVLTLRFHQDALIKKVLADIKAAGLYDKTKKIFLRFEEEPNRKVVNFCKLNFDKVEIHSSSNYGITEFLDVRFKEGGKYVLCYDLREQEDDTIQELLLLHNITEWKYCLYRLMKEGKTARAIGLFPAPSSETKDDDDDADDGQDYWFHTFWVKSDGARSFRTIQDEEKLELLKCSNDGWFQSMDDVQSSVFTYDTSATNEEEEHDHGGKTMAGMPPSFGKKVSFGV